MTTQQPWSVAVAGKDYDHAAAMERALAGKDYDHEAAMERCSG